MKRKIQLTERQLLAIVAGMVVTFLFGGLFIILGLTAVANWFMIVLVLIFAGLSFLAERKPGSIYLEEQDEDIQETSV